jgi:hypothetical protein
MNVINGGCLCGVVRYTSRSMPTRTVICHCKNCQRQSGSSFSIVSIFNSSDFEILGETVDYPDRGDSGNVVTRRFCGKCGSPLISEVASRPGVTIVKAGTLDDASWLKPEAHIWCRSAQPWVVIDPALPQFEGAYGVAPAYVEGATQ